jgi:hypothetical protein
MAAVCLHAACFRLPLFGRFVSVIRVCFGSEIYEAKNLLSSLSFVGLVAGVDWRLLLGIRRPSG